MRNDIKNWVFSCDSMSYNVISAFKELNEVDWGTDKNKGYLKWHIDKMFKR
ncbi:hypothetical protein [Clostridium estertheticum]|uniref:hypothetical protein n=1 Tax=Clostridium estertheticum TaxID=238834 RepID=UPI001C7CE961|nr:hypothetical protein [Clostridium estertheticum]MBX4268436.1 hypothetical protein [Clostridium estertheticum]WLC81504.1 hypothetical protein KTC98_09980 [Clostridium estertheticum]